MEAIIGVRGETVLKKELILASGKLIFWLVETIFLLFFRDLKKPYSTSRNEGFSKFLLAGETASTVKN